MKSARRGLEPFSLSELNPPGFKQNLGFFLLNTVVARVLRFICRLSPAWRIPGTNVVLVTGFDAVQEVYSRHFDFEVPYEARVKTLHWQSFILALQDTPEYHDMYDHIRALWKPDDTAHVQAVARAKTESILSSHQGNLDFIQDLVRPVLMSIVEQHYGVNVPAEHTKSFVDGNLAGSSFMFSKPGAPKKPQLEIATAAVAGVWPVLDAAMTSARANPDPTTILGRYYAAGPDPSFSEAKMRSALMTMIGGYLPTCTNASGRIMDLLLARPDAMTFMRDAVRAGQDDVVLTGIHEALRVDYIIPILWRRTAHDTVIGEGTEKPRKIPKGRMLAVSLQTSMHDRRRIHDPKRFDPDRSPTVRMVYGHEFHYCIGASIANTVLLEIFKGVLTYHPEQAPKKKNQKNRWVGAYPWNLYLALSEPDAAQ